MVKVSGEVKEDQSRVEKGGDKEERVAELPQG